MTLGLEEFHLEFSEELKRYFSIDFSRIASKNAWWDSLEISAGVAEDIPSRIPPESPLEVPPEIPPVICPFFHGFLQELFKEFLQ